MNKIGIIGAMEEEVAILKNEMRIEEMVEHASMQFCKGKLCDRDVVIVRSGIGKVNAPIYNAATALVMVYATTTLAILRPFFFNASFLLPIFLASRFV